MLLALKLLVRESARESPRLKERRQAINPLPLIYALKFILPYAALMGNTYGNECLAAAEGLDEVTAGACLTVAEACPDVFEPVCGVDGNTYSNVCFASVAGTEIENLGACLGSGCPADYDPVCGVNARTYQNRCEAEVERIPVQTCRCMRC